MAAARSLPLSSPCLVFFEPVADAIKCFDLIKIAVDRYKLFSQPLDMAVDGPVIDINLIVIGSIQQGIAAFDHAGA